MDGFMQRYFVNKKDNNQFELSQEDTHHIKTVMRMKLEDLVEEIFGNIYDEHDSRERPDIQKINETQWRVNGNADLDELSEAINIPFPQDEDYNTIGGYIYSHLRSIPKDGTTKTLHIDNLTFQITKIQDRRIKEVIITKKPS